MEQILPVVGVVLGAAAVVLLIALLVKLTRRADGDPQFYAALNDVRRDVTEQNDRTRDSLQAGLDRLTEKSGQMNERALGMQLAVTKTLNEMDRRRAEEDRRSAETLSAAIEKLQRSNEEKLDQMYEKLESQICVRDVWIERSFIGTKNRENIFFDMKREDK